MFHCEFIDCEYLATVQPMDAITAAALLGVAAAIVIVALFVL